MKLKTTEEHPPEYPTFERIERLKAAGIETDGNIYQLTEIMDKKGIKMPLEFDGWYKFYLVDENNILYTFMYLTLVDAIAEKLILINT